MTAMKKSLVTVTGLQHLPGFAWGFRTPTLKLNVIIADDHGLSAAKLTELSSRLEAAITSEELEIKGLEPAPVTTHPVDFILYWTDRSLRLANVPLFESGRVVSRASQFYSAVIPVFFMPYSTMKLIVERLIGIVNLAQAATQIDDHIASFSQLIKQIKGSTQTGTNVPRFLKAAFELGIQTAHISGNIVQYGQGARARWMDSSFTDSTPFIAAGIARNKVMTSTVLHQAGIPVAPHALVVSADHAVAEAHRLGFPVVIKPADRDGGLAVHAGLTTAEEVSSAYTSAHQYSKNILLEKHIQGRDYRLNIFNNEVLWAIERVPAGVTGDGKSSIRQLVDNENLNPMRSEEAHSPLKKLVVDSEALGALKSAGLRPQSIPAKGRFVPLRRRANIGMGGMPVSVMDRIHPDNADLALRSAAILGLDIAGVDLLLPDINRSWVETGGAVCEVNGQPQLGAVTSAHVYGEILQKLVVAGGRIPIALVVGGSRSHEIIARAASQLAGAGIRTGWTDASGVFVSGQIIHPVDTATYTSGKMLMISRDVEAALLRADEESIIANGLPFDRFDILVIAADEAAPGPTFDNRLDDILAMILPACTGKVLTAAGGKRDLRALEALTSARWEREAIDPDSLPGAIADELLLAKAKYDAAWKYDGA